MFWNPAPAPARRLPIGDHLDVSPAFLGPDQRPDNPGADCQPVGANEDLAYGALNRRTAKASQFSSGAKQTATVASDAAEATGRAGERIPIPSSTGNPNTRGLYMGCLNWSI
jgi:hypothetical protein